MANPQAKQAPGVNAEYLQMTAKLLGPTKNQSYSLMRVQSGHQLLDVGCGIGADTTHLARLVGAEGRVVGVDFDPQMVQEARRAAVKQGVSDWTSHETADATALPLKADSFDACRSERLLQHLAQPARALEEMVRVTKSGGWIVILDTDWGTVSIDSTEREIERQLARFLADSIVANGYSGRQLYRLYRGANLEEISLTLLPLLATDYPLLRALACLDQVEERALRAGVLSTPDIERWRKSLESADAKRAFFASVTMILIAGKKP